MFSYKKQWQMCMFHYEWHKTVMSLIKLQALYAAIFTRVEFIEDERRYAKALFTAHAKFWRRMSGLKKYSYPDGSNFFILMQLLHRLYATLCAMHQLRHRLQDPHIYEIAKIELQQLQQALQHVLRQCSRAKPKSINTEELLVSIAALEVLNQRTLNVVVRDPFIFLFFIQSAYDAQELLQQILQRLHVKNT